MNKKTPMDLVSNMPTPMQDYLFYYGWHFNKTACEYAVGNMKKKNSITGKEDPIKPMSKEEVENLLKRYNITLNNNVGYDFVYVANMCIADFLNSSIKDEQHMALYIKDVIEDVDAADGYIMRGWYYNQLGAGKNVFFEDFL